MSRARMSTYAPGIILLVLCVPGWLIDRTLFWATYLAAWWFCVGVALGALSNLWIHNLTGGAWGEAIREPALRLGRAMPLLAVLFVPVLLLGVNDLYTWSAGSDTGAARWSGELSSPQFKSAWLTPWFFIARSIVYLAIWLGLEWMTRSARFNRSRPFSAVALLVYWTSASFAAIDWLMSLMPLWYSTAFPLLVVTGQMLAGFAAVVLAVAVQSRSPRPLYRDLGNLLLVYVLCWAYLAFTQYLIIWAENLPHEIAWYVARLHTQWYWAGWVLVAFHFFVPLLVLLSRDAKQAPFIIGLLAAGLLLLHLIDVWWLVVPSVRPASIHVLWLGPLAALALAILAGVRVRAARLDAWELSRA
ncbi:MAG: hypothetical protein ACXWCY_07480 [Burkholderiales bacterium]